MKTQHIAIVAAFAGCGAFVAPATAQGWAPDYKLSGFGTLAAVHSSDSNSDFVGTIFQPNGAGHTSRTSINPDSKLGGQLNAVFNDRFSGVVQVIAQHQYNNGYTPQIEWANVKYQLLPELSVRAGRIAAPLYLLSESRFVGYANPWVRPPTDLYSLLPITSSDGVDATWRTQVSGANNSVQVYFGRNSVKSPGGVTVKTKPLYGINDTVEIGSLSLRAGYNRFKLDLNIAALQPLLDAATQFGLPGIADKYKLKGIDLSALALGFNYDPGNWFVMGEFVDLKGGGFASDARAWYLSAGYRFGSLTPYLTHTSTRARINAETAAGPLNVAFTSALYAGNATEATSSIGVRWDAMKNVALKAQYDHVKTGDQSTGRLIAYSGFVPGSSVNLVTLAVDFVF